MRLKQCKRCGRTFETATPDTYMCPECRDLIRRESVVKERTCKTCGRIFNGGPRALYCPDCRAERQKKQHNKPTRRPLGSTDLCAVCGEPYIVTSGLQKYCPSCAKEAVHAVVRKHKKEYTKKNASRLNAHKYEMRSNGWVCVICGKIFDKDSPTVTCSAECAERLRQVRQAETDLKRGKRKMSPYMRYDSGLPKSGIVGVTYHRKLKKWQATYKSKYLGVFDTIEDAANAIELSKSKKD